MSEGAWFNAFHMFLRIDILHETYLNIVSSFSNSYMSIHLWHRAKINFSIQNNQFLQLIPNKSTKSSQNNEKSKISSFFFNNHVLFYQNNIYLQCAPWECVSKQPKEWKIQGMIHFLGRSIFWSIFEIFQSNFSKDIAVSEQIIHRNSTFFTRRERVFHLQGRVFHPSKYVFHQVQVKIHLQNIKFKYFLALPARNHPRENVFFTGSPGGKLSALTRTNCTASAPSPSK